jgi:hypothetical protein
LVLREKAVGQESVAGPAAPGRDLRFPAVLALPLLGLAVYLVLYMSGLWRLGSVQLAPLAFYGGPIPFLAFAAIVSSGVSWYTAARTPAVLAGAAVLVVLLSLVSIGQIAAIQQLLPSVTRNPLLLPAVSLTASALTSTAVMLVAGAVAPALRKLSYWLVALILWPFAALLLSFMIPIAAVNWHLDQSSMQHLAFAVLLFRQCIIIFGCIGYWLDRANRRDSAISLVF